MKPPGTASYLAAVAAVVAAAIARWLLDPLLGRELPFFTFYFAVLFAAWYGGWEPGILSLGFDGHIVKPVDYDVLMKLLASLASRPAQPTRR